MTSPSRKKHEHGNSSNGINSDVAKDNIVDACDI